MSRRLSQKEFDFHYGRVPRLCVDLVVKRKMPPSVGSWYLPGGTVRFEEIDDQSSEFNFFKKLPPKTMKEHAQFLKSLI